MLTREQRIRWMKYVGYEYSKQGILKMQKDWFPNKADHDGFYGPDTDALLRHLRNVKKYAPNFSPEEFRCGCGGRYCTGYPTRMKVIELKHLQAIRNHYKKPVEVTSGLRCKQFNSMLSGSSSQSRHKTGYACDIYIKGVTDTLNGRKKLIKWLKKQPHHHWSYGNGWCSLGYAVSAPNMGNAVHTDTAR